MTQVVPLLVNGKKCEIIPQYPEELQHLCTEVDKREGEKATFTRSDFFATCGRPVMLVCMQCWLS